MRDGICVCKGLKRFGEGGEEVTDSGNNGSGELSYCI